MPKRYRKKPVVIEAGLLKESNLAAVAEWCGGIAVDFYAYKAGRSPLVIPTLEGDMYAEFGDYIIKGVAGEFYPCKPDIFAATYELVADDEGETPASLRCASCDFCRAAAAQNKCPDHGTAWMASAPVEGADGG